MAEGFSGEPLTRWDGKRNMILEEDFTYIDPDGKSWRAPKGSRLNGATIPRTLWALIGSPYSGKYRRASVIHDVFVGELSSEDVARGDRKKADHMFYHACRFDGCSIHFSLLLYIGVRFGTWSSTVSSSIDDQILGEDYEEFWEVPEEDDTTARFEEIVKKSENMMENENLDLIDDVIDEYEDF